MANQTANYVAAASSVNNMLPVVVQYELDSALASSETLTLTLPAHLTNSLAAAFLNYVPVGFCIWSNADPQLPLWQPHTANSLVLTSHDRDTATTIFTAGSAGVADSSVISVMYLPQTLGT